MGALPTELRNQLAKACVAARETAEAGARSALQAVAVHHHEPHGSMTPEARALRNRLRAHGRQLGDTRDRQRGTQTIDRLVHECAYEHWHRMLFARFLAENHLLIEPTSGAAITMEECQDLARESGQDPWTLASRFAQRMLPQIFRPDDPVLEVALPPETRQSLERLLADVPAAVFTADDALGWTYQFWQSAEKDRANASGEKITGATLPAVTQLFTEHYMVLFLLHNTVGAWHAGKVLLSRDRQGADNDIATEADARRAVALPSYEFEYLRLVRGADGNGGPWRPAAGTFDGWPRAAKDLKVLDPCCGSGHFLVAAFELLVRLRMAEEGLALEDAIRAVLKDNLFGLEIDQRCCQIAAFDLALAGWKWAGRVIDLPPLNIACSGLGPHASKDEWFALAERAAASAGMPARRDLFRSEESLLTSPLKAGLEALYDLFAQAPELGSLIDPRRATHGRELIAGDFATLRPLLEAALDAERRRENSRIDDETRERAIAAAGMVKAADLLAREYTLVITNVPYLARGKQCEPLKEFIEQRHHDAKQDLATAFLSRAVECCAMGATVAMVTPQNWLFLTSYEGFRKRLLRTTTWNNVAKLGERGFESPQAAGAFTALVTITGQEPCTDSSFAGIDASEPRDPQAKASILRGAFAGAEGASILALYLQRQQLRNPDARIVLADPAASELLCKYTGSYQGLATADFPRYGRRYWELPKRTEEWEFQQSTVLETKLYGGREAVVLWQQGQGELSANPQARVQGLEAHGKVGVAVAQMRGLCSTLYTGEVFDNNTSALTVNRQADLPAVWCFCSSPQFCEEVRKIDHKVNVTNATLAKVPFDLNHWKTIAAKKYPDGLPEPESDDPTQWLFHGRPEESTAPLHVAIARLLGYRWPAELDDKMRLSERARALVKRCEELARFADEDGIFCIPALRGERYAADRLLALLTACGVKPDRDLDAWLRDDFFAEHCAMFHHRPFVWHIWDGRRDGFNALVNYHRLAGPAGEGRRTLESLTFSYLGDWIERQKAEQREGREGADARLAAAQDLQEQLKKILEGEPPYDIFVRWKPLHEQPIGWEPDINDGVRLNIRPFMMATLRKGGRAGAGILRARPNINWNKDRGKEPQSLRPKADFPWFWSCDPEKHADHRQDFMGGAKFDGNRWNDLHYSNDAKRAARVCRPREAAS